MILGADPRTRATIPRLKDQSILEHHVTTRRIDNHGSEATTKNMRIALDTNMAGRAVVEGCVCPSRFPITDKEAPLRALKAAKGIMESSDIPASLFRDLTPLLTGVLS